MRTIFHPLAAAAFLCALVVTNASATTLYYNDFQNGPVGKEWSASLTDTVPNPQLASWGRFLGQFSGNQSAKLSLAGVPKGMVTLSFDSYFIRSWDGNGSDYGPDRFKVAVGNGPTLLDDTFSNGNPGGQSYVGNGVKPAAYAGSTNSSMTGSSQQYSLGYFFWDGVRGTYEAEDSVYHFSFSFLNDAEAPLDVVFAGINLQGNYVTDPYGKTYYDESWGLDNVQVDVAPVPEPSTLALLAGPVIAALAWAGARRRKGGITGI